MAPGALLRLRNSIKLLLAGIVWVAAVTGQTHSPSAASPANSRLGNNPAGDFHWPNGQTFTYLVDWRLFQAGVATIHVDMAGREQRIYSTADAVGVVSLLYHVHDTFESFAEPQNFCSRMITKHTEEGLRRLDTNIVFDQSRRKAVLNEKNLRKNNEAKRQENDTPGCVGDVLSSLFYIASLPLEDRKSYDFPLNDGGQTVNVRASVEAREEIQLPAGRFKTIRVQSVATTGKSKDRGQIWIWYSDDAARIPVQMKARLFWGTLTLRLQPGSAQK